ncbi:MAG: UDP-N-acetylglucosamine acyltransferase, partial [Candidatus Paceibacteria bacterium]
CWIEDKVIMANNVMLAGHVHIGTGVNISGAVGCHHFVTIGDYTYVGGMTRIEHDLPPYMVVEGRRSRVRNVNVVGLQRAGFSEEDIECLRAVYRKIFRSSEPRSQAIESMKMDAETPDIVHRLLENLASSEEGKRGRFREGMREEFAIQGAARLAAGVRP